MLVSANVTTAVSPCQKEATMNGITIMSCLTLVSSVSGFMSIFCFLPSQLTKATSLIWLPSLLFAIKNPFPLASPFAIKNPFPSGRTELVAKTRG